MELFLVLIYLFVFLPLAHFFFNVQVVVVQNSLRTKYSLVIIEDVTLMFLQISVSL